MGKVKRQPRKHSNHHDNPPNRTQPINRRQHSQVKPQKKPSKTRSQSTISVGQRNIQLNIPFNPKDNVLLVGEGDFTFTRSLLRYHTPAAITATCFDTKEILEGKYPNVKNYVESLSSSRQWPLDKARTTDAAKSINGHDNEETNEWEGFSPQYQSDTVDDDFSDSAQSSNSSSSSSKFSSSRVLYGIDATKLATSHKKALRKYAPFTKIVFNFPHVGGLSTDVNRQVRSNQQLLVGFFSAAKPLLSSPPKPPPVSQQDYFESSQSNFSAFNSWADSRSPKESVKGQVLVTLFEGEPYTLWNIRDLARHCGLQVIESFKFPWSAYPGYHHARTIGDIVSSGVPENANKGKSGWKGEDRAARCYVFEIKDDGRTPKLQKPRKRSGSSSPSDDDGK